jgi:hypothetical protein
MNIFRTGALLVLAVLIRSSGAITAVESRLEASCGRC